MILGTRARPRHSIKRTTSMTEFSFDDLSVLHQEGSTPGDVVVVAEQQRQTLIGLVSPRLINRRNSADFATTRSSTAAASATPFLRYCNLCRRRLAPARDIFMYRGDTGFCSSECRQQQMAQDEYKERCANNSSSSTTNGNKPSISTSTSSKPEASDKGGSVAAS